MDYLFIFFNGKIFTVFLFGVKNWKISDTICRAARVEERFNKTMFHRVTADDRARQISGRFSGQLHPSAAK